MSSLLIPQDSASEAAELSHSFHPVLALGFRPFYLLAAAFAAVSIPAWLGSYYGLFPSQRITLLWHVHEMVFGFFMAVIVGFLYTAGRNWTNLWTPRGKTLAAIAGLWLAGRIAMLAAPPMLGAMVDLAFLPVAAWPLYRVLKQAGNKRNMFLIGLLGLLTVANAGFHAASFGWLPVSPLQPVYAALMLVVVIESVIGGRVIPMFTRNAVKGAEPVTDLRRDKLSLGLTATVGAAWILALPATVVAPLALLAAAAQAWRLAGWKPLRTLRNPLLWVLHMSYAWIPSGFLLLALAQFEIVSTSAAVHVLAVGSVSGLIMGMITRTALGHTGRMLAAGKAETAMFVLIQAGVIARFLAAVAPAVRDATLLLAGACWAAAFLLYLCTFGPYLFQPRVDGRED